MAWAASTRFATLGQLSSARSQTLLNRNHEALARPFGKLGHGGRLHEAGVA